MCCKNDFIIEKIYIIKRSSLSAEEKQKKLNECYRMYYYNILVQKGMYAVKNFPDCEPVKEAIKQYQLLKK